MAPEVKAAFDKIVACAEKLNAAVQAALEALAEAQSFGVEVRQSDVDLLHTRLGEQVSRQIRMKAGSLLPPVHATLVLKLDPAEVKGA